MIGIGCRDGALVACLFLYLGLSVDTASAKNVDLEIVLAVDASGSVDQHEFKLQLGGIADALRDPSIQHALLSGPRGAVAASLLVWSDSAFPKFKTRWHVLNSDATANHFADVVETFHHKTGRSRGIGGGGTSIGDAVAYALTMLDNNGINAARRVIDVSGDGIETPPWFGDAVTLPQARVMAATRGVMVNGLAIINDFPRLDAWYRDHLVVGAGSFVIVAEDYHDFKRAIVKKLWREIASPTAMLETGPRFGAAAGAEAISRVARIGALVPSPRRTGAPRPSDPADSL